MPLASSTNRHLHMKDAPTHMCQQYLPMICERSLSGRISPLYYTLAHEVRQTALPRLGAPTTGGLPGEPHGLIAHSAPSSIHKTEQKCGDGTCTQATTTITRMRQPAYRPPRPSAHASKTRVMITHQGSGLKPGSMCIRTMRSHCEVPA